MDILDSKSNQEIVQSLLAEIAKARNELQCAQRDVDKATGRLAFTLVMINALLDRYED